MILSRLDPFLGTLLADKNQWYAGLRLRFRSAKINTLHSAQLSIEKCTPALARYRAAVKMCMGAQIIP